MRTHERIFCTMTGPEIIDAMSDGLPGAIAVATRIYVEGGDVDPDNPLRGLSPILSLDSLGIYGARLWRLYKACLPRGGRSNRDYGPASLGCWLCGQRVDRRSHCRRDEPGAGGDRQTGQKSVGRIFKLPNDSLSKGTPVMPYTFRGFTIPGHMERSLRDYILKGFRVGAFLSAVLDNDLALAVSLADEQNLANLPRPSSATCITTPRGPATARGRTGWHG